MKFLLVKKIPLHIYCIPPPIIPTLHSVSPSESHLLSVEWPASHPALPSGAPGASACRSMNTQLIVN